MWWLVPAVVLLIFILLAAIKILNQWEKGIILTLGRYSYTAGPGLNFVVPLLQQMIKVDMRINTTDIPKQEVMTKDNVPLLVNAVVYFKVERPEDAIMKIQDYAYAVSQYTQTALRDVIGNNELDFVLTERVKVADSIKKIVDDETSEWGIDISSIKIQEIELPAEMKRAMAKQAEAERDRRAVIIVSEGELAASNNLMKAAANLSKSAGALHLRTLQTIKEISADPSDKIIFALPVEILRALEKLGGKK